MRNDARSLDQQAGDEVECRSYTADEAMEDLTARGIQVPRVPRSIMAHRDSYVGAAHIQGEVAIALWDKDLPESGLVAEVARSIEEKKEVAVPIPNIISQIKHMVNRGMIQSYESGNITMYEMTGRKNRAR